MTPLYFCVALFGMLISIGLDFGQASPESQKQLEIAFMGQFANIKKVPSPGIGNISSRTERFELCVKVWEKSSGRQLGSYNQRRVPNMDTRNLPFVCIFNPDLNEDCMKKKITAIKCPMGAMSFSNYSPSPSDFFLMDSWNSNCYLKITEQVGTNDDGQFVGTGRYRLSSEHCLD